MSIINKSESNLPADFNCKENDYIGFPNLIGNVSHLDLLLDCDNSGKSREVLAV